MGFTSAIEIEDTIGAIGSATTPVLFLAGLTATIRADGRFLDTASRAAALSLKLT